MAQPYRKNAVYGSLAYDLDALVRERKHYAEVTTPRVNRLRLSPIHGQVKA